MKPTKLLIFILLSGLFQGLMAQNNFHNTHYQDPYNPAYDTGVVLVKFKDDVDMKVYKSGKGIVQTGYASVDKFLEQYEAKEMDKVFRNAQKRTTKKTFSFGGETKEVPQLFNIYKIELDTKTSTEQMVEELQADPLVEYAEPDYLVYTQEDKSTTEYNPNDPLYQDGSQWYLDAINAPAAWEITTGDTNQVIAIIDTGVDWDHPDLDDNIWTSWDEIPDNGIDDDGNGYVDDVRGWDFINEDNDPNDDNSHGTHVAGIAAAEGNNEIGITGVAFNSRIMPVKMLQSTGIGNSSDLSSAINYAGENGASVINMSLGSYGESLTVKSALENAYAETGDGEGSILVAAAGNDSKRTSQTDPQCSAYAPMFPASYSWVLGVMAQDAGPCEGFSNWDFNGPVAFEGYNYEIQAKGVGIMSTKPNGGYWNKSGTSMAAPIVSGIASMYRAVDDTIPQDFIWSKLIFGSDENDVVNAYNTLTLDLDSIGPDLRFMDFTLVDTLPGCDNDGRADADETIQLYYTVKNVGGYADSVWSKIRFGQFEDTTVAVVNDSISYIGDMSTWSTLSGELSPLEITIDENVAHNRDIVFEYEIILGENNSHLSGELIINVEKGIELSGVLTEDDTLVPDYLYLVNNSFRVGANATLYIRPGTEIQIQDPHDIDVRGNVQAIGTPDSLVKIYSSGQPYKSSAFFHGEGSSGDYIYCEFRTLQNAINVGYYDDVNVNVKNSIFIDCNAIQSVNNFINNRVIGAIYGTNVSPRGLVKLNNCYNKTQLHISSSGCDNNNIIGSKCSTSGMYSYWDNQENSFIALRTNSFEIAEEGDLVNVPNQYWGSTKEDEIQRIIYDFWDDNSLAIADPNPILTQPSPINHGHVWKVEINEINPFEEELEPLGSGTYQFDIFFNKCMNTAFTPQLSFGVTEPYLQRIVNDNALWSNDSTIWTAYYTIGHETGDGINKIRVEDAVDTAGFEIPPEKDRFEFLIQAAGAQSVNFLATPGIGKVDLEWPPATTDDALGYNLYRFHNLTDSTYSDTTMINNELILDTLYTDFEVIPDTSYHYLYKTVGTDMAETDYSKVVHATPFTAANGDANGSMEVDVLDITTIVNYMLGNAPEPFLFDAADVNYDGNINVLDIIGVVQIIQGNKSVPLSKAIATSNTPATISKEGKTIRLESEGNVAALSFELQGEELDKLKLLSKTKGFEFALNQSDSLIKGILYSLSGSTIPEGKVTLFETTETLTATTFGALTGGDWEGNYVPVLKEGEELPKPESYQLQAYPNPFTGQTTIQYDLPEQSDVTITIYDMSGKVVWQQQKHNLRAGNYEYLWNSSETKGMYLLTIQAKGATQKWEKQVKLVQLK